MWQKYEREKAKLIERNLSPADYQREIKKLAGEIETKLRCSYFGPNRKNAALGESRKMILNQKSRRVKIDV